ncbi:MAG: hypothetical protein EAZ65_04335 [Verrucomicrobia bacterium]|nr:MAG: hypothetical protein EAZ84_00550 [Verrucomicrobiota bacterium]TAE87973.1 MAG: hypothetical protein EAZ82_05585 [Verrucomicrobiota bacterium]TAF26197.1 MAG: hypothetical protein EAZ71_05150 [Verrucomicrobiota bacterium]TAF41752.1 MAG: hypothetical protein EAZ65_04335 [Verrucomicrobiota bacterium]
MKVAPLLKGGLRIDVESPLDWRILRGITQDARTGGLDLADRVSSAMLADPESDDWRDYVVPDLRDGFDAQLAIIERAVADAATTAAGCEEPGRIFIHPEEAEDWFGGLNQARLALEERHNLSAAIESEMTPGRRSAWFRSQFYADIQGMLLTLVMR